MDEQIQTAVRVFKKSKRVLKYLLSQVHNRKSKLTPSQKLALVAMKHCNKLVIESERISGSTVTMLMHAVWYAHNNPFKTVVVLSPCPRDTMATLKAYIGTLYGDLDAVRREYSGIKFHNGARIIIRKMHVDSVRGMTVNLLMVEQANRLSREGMQNMMMSILPCMAATRGTMVIQTEDHLDIPGFTKIKMHALPKEQPFC